MTVNKRAAPRGGLPGGGRSGRRGSVRACGATWNEMTDEKLKRPLLSRWPAAFLAAVLIGTTALVLYVEASVSKLKQVLPVEVLRQERDVVFMIDDLAALQAAIREARAAPSRDRRQAIVDRLDLIER